MRKTITNIIALFLTLFMISGISGCVPDPVTTTITETNITTTTQLSMVTETSTDTVTVTETVSSIILDGTPPIVSVSNHNYSLGDVVGFMYDAGDSSIWTNAVEWAVSNRQAFIDSAVAKAEELQLNSENLQEMLTKLVFNIDQLDFTGKNISEDGESEYPFRLSSQTVHLPYWIEKAEYKGQEAWIISLNWEDSDILNNLMSHIAVVVFEYGTDNVLFAMSCM
ncbi:MAG: hypothetical protein WC142_09630 [Bacteroidales bacterium]|jgi:hypothetical protein